MATYISGNTFVGSEKLSVQTVSTVTNCLMLSTLSSSASGEKNNYTAWTVSLERLVKAGEYHPPNV